MEWCAIYEYRGEAIADRFDEYEASKKASELLAIQINAMEGETEGLI